MTRYALLNLTDGSDIQADSRSAIVDALIPAHGTVPDGETHDAIRIGLRNDYLARVAETAQAVIVASLTEQSPDAVAAFDDDARTALFHDRFGEALEISDWDSDVPLFVLASNYAPYTERPRPTGEHVVFLDPATETTFIDSLKAAGIAELYVLAGE